MSLVSVVLFLFVASLAGADDNEKVDKALAELVSKAGDTTSPDRAFGFRRTIGPMDMRFTLLFSSGKMRLTRAARSGDARAAGTGGLGFRAEVTATADYLYKLSTVGELQSLSAGKARVDWVSGLQGELAVDGCSVTLASLAISTKRFDVDIWPNDDQRSATVHPPSTNEFQTALKPILEQYLKSSFANIQIC